MTPIGARVSAPILPKDISCGAARRNGRCAGRSHPPRSIGEFDRIEVAAPETLVKATAGSWHFGRWCAGTCTTAVRTPCRPRRR